MIVNGCPDCAPGLACNRHSIAGLPAQLPLDGRCPDNRDYASCPKCQGWQGQRHDPLPLGHCCVCGLRLLGAFYGMGDGTGQRFGCPECYWRGEAARLEDEVRILNGALKDQRELEEQAKYLQKLLTAVLRAQR
jgi:hypothetical protein